jgi:hypothetical protein
MKKILIYLTVLLLLITSLPACSERETIVNPANNLPFTYEIVYEIHNPDDTVIHCISGRDAEFNAYYLDLNGRNILYHAREKYELLAGYYNVITDAYLLNAATGQYELISEKAMVVRRNFDDLISTAYNASLKSNYRQIDELTMLEEFEGEALYLDTARFNYYQIVSPYGSLYEVAVERKTGICFYACYDNGYAFSIVQYTTPYEGNYADLLPEKTEDTTDAENTESAESGEETGAPTEAPTESTEAP